MLKSHSNFEFRKEDFNVIKKMWSKWVLLLTIMVASLSLTSMSKVSAACKPEQVKSIEEQIEEYVSILEQESNLAVIYSDVAIREKSIGRTMRASLRLDDARRFAKNVKKALVEVQNLIREVRTQRTQNALLRAVRATIDTEREIRAAEAALSGKNDEVESSVIRSGSEFNLELLLVIKDK